MGVNIFFGFEISNWGFFGRGLELFWGTFVGWKKLGRVCFRRGMNYVLFWGGGGGYILGHYTFLVQFKPDHTFEV